MTLRKATDEEIKFAKLCRNNTKIANFAFLYSCGMKTYAQSLIKANPELSEARAMKLAYNAFKLKKGVKSKDTGLYHGGTDSDVFNAMYKMAMNGKTRLPVLGSRISEALRPNVCGTNYLTSRMNYNIQGSGLI